MIIIMIITVIETCGCSLFYIFNFTTSLINKHPQGPFYDAFLALYFSHRYQRKINCLSIVMSLVQAFALPRVLLHQQLTVLTRQTRQAVHAINQSIFCIMSMTFPMDWLQSIVYCCHRNLWKHFYSYLL